MEVKAQAELLSAIFGEPIPVIRCEGCGELRPGNTGFPGDPVKDVTYRPEAKTFVCDKCYHDRSWFRKSVVDYVNAQFDYPMSVN